VRHFRLLEPGTTAAAGAPQAWEWWAPGFLRESPGMTRTRGSSMDPCGPQCGWDPGQGSPTGPPN